MCSQCQMADVSKAKIKETNKTLLFLKKKRTLGPGCCRDLLLLTSGLYLDKSTKNCFVTINGLGIFYTMTRISKSSHTIQLKGISKIKESGRETGLYTKT